MKAKYVTYSRLISKGNYENEKIELCLEVEDGEKVNDVFASAKKFVDLKADAGKISDYAFEQAKRVLADPDNHTGNQIADAKKIIERAEANGIEELPF